MADSSVKDITLPDSALYSNSDATWKGVRMPLDCSSLEDALLMSRGDRSMASNLSISSSDRFSASVSPVRYSMAPI